MTPDHGVRNVGLNQRFFNHPRLGVGPVQDGKIAVIVVILLSFFLNLSDHVMGLVIFILSAIIGDGFALRILRPEVLFLPVNVALNHVVGGLQDGLGRPVVLFQQRHVSVRVVVLKVQDVFHIGTPPPVDTLVTIPDDAEIVVLLRQHVDQHVLGVVGILIFIDVDVLELVLIVRQDLLIVLK